MPTGIYTRTEEEKTRLKELRKGKKSSESHKIKMSIALKGRKLSSEHCKKLSKALTGRKLSEEHKKRMAILFKGENAPNWRGGKTPINKIIRTSKEYHLWRTAVFIRDNRTCVWCGYMGQLINADHIKPFALYPELRFAIDNGRTLCVPCHRKTDTYAGKLNLKSKDIHPEAFGKFDRQTRRSITPAGFAQAFYEANK